MESMSHKEADFVGQGLGCEGLFLPSFIQSWKAGTLVGVTATPNGIQATLSGVGMTWTGGVTRQLASLRLGQVNQFIQHPIPPPPSHQKMAEGENVRLDLN